ncbi:thioredoxin family protein [Bacillus carboniphilus]|uniref:Thioredoxin family protein n=1 Tax=Bacillus carboniphilus TaxID=86663 RepID=A0ABN0W6J1_9BACI
MEQLTREEASVLMERERPYFLYLYTPMCGTCHLAEKMLTVIDELDPSMSIGKTDINYIPEFAELAEIESVPCLVFIKDKTIHQKLYAFQSVPHLLEKMKTFNR